MSVITWDIVKMECSPQHDGHDKVVSTCHWTLSGTDGTYSSYAYGATPIAYEADDAFTHYESLTKDQVIGWVKEALGNERAAAYEASVAAQIDIQANPPIVSPPLPWSE